MILYNPELKDTLPQFEQNVTAQSYNIITTICVKHNEFVKSMLIEDMCFKHSLDPIPYSVLLSDTSQTV